MESLKQYFTGVAGKHLSAVDATPKSNQHEIGSNRFTQILGNPGSSKIRLEGVFLYFDDENDTPLRAAGILTWYDTRLNQPNRNPEYRLYYQRNVVTAKMTEGDFCIVAVKPDRSLLVVISPQGSTSEQQLRWLFGIEQLPQKGYEIHEVSERSQVGFVEGRLLEELGVEVRQDNDKWLDQIIEHFGESFPSTAVFSNFARNSCTEAPLAQDDPDGAIMGWLAHEEMLFRTMERYLVQRLLDSGFESVDHFIHASLSIQNRRKSRVGHALEHHLAAVFVSHQLPFERQVKTEHKSTADFLFPGSVQYHDPNFPNDQLIMLASKSTCKDRWRQVLAEASRISTKHLFTLEPSISDHQTTEMRSHLVQLVVPNPLIDTYSDAQQKWLLNLAQFIELTKTAL